MSKDKDSKTRQRNLALSIVLNALAAGFSTAVIGVAITLFTGVELSKVNWGLVGVGTIISFLSVALLTLIVDVLKTRNEEQLGSSAPSTTTSTSVGVVAGNTNNSGVTGYVAGDVAGNIDKSIHYHGSAPTSKVPAPPSPMPTSSPPLTPV